MLAKAVFQRHLNRLTERLREQARSHKDLMRFQKLLAIPTTDMRH